MFEIQNLIYVYILLCFAMMIFNLFYMIYNNSSKKSIQKRNKILIKKIDMQMTLIKSRYRVTTKHKKYLAKKLQKVSNLYLLEEAIKIYSNKEAQQYVNEISITIIELCKDYIKKDTLSKAYLAHFIAKYEIGYKRDIMPINNYLFSLLESEELYCIDNAMTAFYRLGDLKNVIKALKIIDKKESYQNIEMIVRGLLLYHGDYKELENALWSEFYNYTDKVEVAIINYITILDENDWNTEMYNLLTKEKLNKSVKIAIINYFTKYPDERVREILYNIIETVGSKETDYLIAVIKALKNYPGEETVKILKKMLQNNQWNIQVEASRTLKYLNVNYFELADIYNGENQKARNILKYVIKK